MIITNNYSVSKLGNLRDSVWFINVHNACLPYFVF